MYKIFLVDDEVLTLEYLKAAIPRLCPCWEIAGTALNGAEAHEMLGRVEADLVLTDIKMPVMDGIELAKRLYSERRGLLTALLSGYGEFSIAQEAMRHGVIEYLLKPIKDDELVMLLKKCEAKICQSREEQLKLHSLSTLSEDYRHQISENYLKAILHGEDAEISVYHPLLHRLKIDMIEAVGCVMLLDIDLAELLSQGLDAEEYPLHTYLLLVAAKETAWNENHGRAVINSSGTVAVFLTSDDAETLLNVCKSVFEKLYSFMKSHFNISIFGAIGSVQCEMLEIAQSSSDAAKLLWQWVLYGCGKEAFIKSDEKAELLQKRLRDEAVKIQSAIQSKADLYVAALAYFELLEPNAAAIKRGLVFLLKLIQIDKSETACVLKLLQEACGSNGFTKEKAMQCLCSGLLVSNTAVTSTDYLTLALAYIQNNFTQPITLYQIADSLKVSPGYLGKLFHDLKGETYAKYLTRLRMEHAAYLLKSKGIRRVGQAAELSGYCSVKHFNYVFKEYYGITPGQFQKQHCGED